MTHFDSHDILNPFKHGFRSKHSCETQLISFTQEIFDNLEKEKQTDLIVMDLVKPLIKLIITSSYTNFLIWGLILK